MHSDTYIPRRLDDQWKIGFWDADVAAPPLFACMAGYVSGSTMVWVVSIAVALVISRWLTRVKADKHPSFALHWLYWWMPANPVSALRCTPPSHLLRMVG